VDDGLVTLESAFPVSTTAAVSAGLARIVGEATAG